MFAGGRARSDRDGVCRAAGNRPRAFDRIGELLIRIRTLEREKMRVGFIDLGGKGRSAGGQGTSRGATPAVAAKASGMIPDMIPLYDAEQFEGLVQRERARADRAAAKPRPDTSHRRTEAKKGPGGSKLDPVWGATTDNREFSLVIFRPRTRTDRSGLVELLQTSVRTTDAVGIVDNRRLGVLPARYVGGECDSFREKSAHRCRGGFGPAQPCRSHLSKQPGPRTAARPGRNLAALSQPPHQKRSRRQSSAMTMPIAPSLIAVRVRLDSRDSSAGCKRRHSGVRLGVPFALKKVHRRGRREDRRQRSVCL